MESSNINPILTIEYICKNKENQFFDRKSARKDVKDMADHISAFANASGGTLVIGVDNFGKIEGFEDVGEEKFNKFLKVTSIDYLKTVPNYENEIIEVENYKGNKDKILLIHVDPSSHTLIRTSRDEVYLRQGDSTNKLSSEQIRILEADRREVTFEEQIHMRTSIEDIDMDMLEIYKKAVGADKTDSLDLLRARGFLVKTENGEHLSNAGTLLFTKDPSKFFVTARVRVVKFEGDKMKTGASLNVVKDKTFTLPLYKAIKETLAFVDTQLREFSFLGNNGHFVTVPEYPKFAWEEGITNAITHRNYTISGEYIKVFIYDDRVEILSPGGLPGIVTLENIREKRYARNPLISRVLTELGVVKEFNEGVDRIYKEMKESSLKEPEYIEDSDFLLKLIIKNNEELRNRNVEKEKKTQEKAQVTAQEKAQDDLENKILNYCKEARSLKEIVEYFGYKSVRRFRENYINSLLKENKLKLTIPDKPNSRNQKYVKV